METRLDRQPSGGAPRPGAGKPAQQPDRLHRKVSPVLLVAAIVVMVGVLGAGAYWAYNGGWKSGAAKDWEWKHVNGPILAAKRGMTKPLEDENARRKAAGQPLLTVPPDRHQSMADAKQKLADLQQKLHYGQPGGQSGGQ